MVRVDSNLVEVLARLQFAFVSLNLNATFKFLAAHANYGITHLILLIYRVDVRAGK
jgi:hypothetical protein